MSVDRPEIPEEAIKAGEAAHIEGRGPAEVVEAAAPFLTAPLSRERDELYNERLALEADCEEQQERADSAEQQLKLQRERAEAADREANTLREWHASAEERLDQARGAIQRTLEQIDRWVDGDAEVGNVAGSRADRACALLLRDEIGDLLTPDLESEEEGWTVGQILRHPNGSEWKLVEHLGGTEDDWRALRTRHHLASGCVGDEKVFHREYMDRTFTIALKDEAASEGSGAASEPCKICGGDEEVASESRVYWTDVEVGDRLSLYTQVSGADRASCRPGSARR